MSRWSRPIVTPSSRVQPLQLDDDDDGNGDMVGFSGMRNSVSDWDAIERVVEEQLELLTTDDPQAWSARTRQHGQHPDGNDDDEEVDGFLSHQPEYHQSIIAKRLQLYEKQLAIREKQLQTLQYAHNQAKQTIQTLQSELETQQREFDAARDEWEEEKMDFLRFRGGPGGTGGGPTGGAGGASHMMMFQMKMGVSAAAMAARSRMNEVEAQKQREMRMNMLAGAAAAQDLLDAEDDATLATQSVSSRFFSPIMWKKLQRVFLRRVYPFATDIRQIEARFGYSVASYFRFFRWIIMSFVAISIPGLVFLVLHVLVLRQVAIVLPVDWTTFVGVAPRFLLLSGYYPYEAMMYSVVLVTMEAFLLLFTVRKWIAEDKLAKTIEAMDDGDKAPKFSKVILNAWDFSLATQEQVTDLTRSLAEQIKVAMEEEKTEEVLARRTRREWYILYVRRTVAFLIYCIVQAASWYLIILLTTQSSEIQAWIASKAAMLAPYTSSIVPAVVTVINAALPAILSALTTLEKWDDVGFAIKAMVTRLYLAKVLNVLIQLVSYALLLDPTLLTAPQSIMDLVAFDGASVRRNVMLAFKPALYACRAEQVASGLLTLVVTDFTVSKIGAIASPAVSWTTLQIGFLIARFKEQRRHGKATAMVTPLLEPTSDLAPATLQPVVVRPPSSIAKPTLSTPQIRPKTTAETRPTTAADVPAMTSPVATTTVPSKPATQPRPQLQKGEFLVPQKMVALLYSCTIALVAIPLAPTTAILALVLHVINFKFDKLILMYFQKKPTSPWSAKDAGSFFIKFYFCTIMIFLIFTHFFLSNTHLPKQCSDQDELSLCLSSTYDPNTQRCTIDPSHSSSSYFLDTTHPKAECSDGYPKCLCRDSFACGPFITVHNGYTPVVQSIQSIHFVAAWYRLVLSSTGMAWGMVGVFLLACFFLRNSLKVHMIMASTREHDVAITFASLRKKIKQLENRLRLQKLGTGDVHEDQSDQDDKR